MLRRFDCEGTKNDLHCGWIETSVLPANPEFDTEVETKNNLIIFGKECDIRFVTHSDVEWLFTMCRKIFMQLNTVVVEVPSEVNLYDTLERKSSLEMYRSDIFMVFYYVHLYLKKCLINSVGSLIGLLDKVETNLRNLSTLFHRLYPFCLSDQFLHEYKNETNFFNPAYHLIHCHLDFRWFFILAQKRLQTVKKLSNVCTQDFSKIDEGIIVIMYELILTSVIKFKKNELSHDNCIFVCTCVEEFWSELTLLLSAEKFWNYLSKVLLVILGNKTENGVLSEICVRSKWYLSSSEFKFVLHFYTNLITSRVVKTHHQDSSERFQLLDDITKTFLSTNPPEKELRDFLRKIYQILSACDHSHQEIVILLWECYYKKLNSAFLVPGDEEDVQRGTVAGLLDEINARFVSKANVAENENSYSIFLRILGQHFRQCRVKGLPSQKLYGRISIKFHVTKKILEFSELGILHIVMLFLTSAVALDIEAEVKKLCVILQALPSKELPPLKRTVIWKSLMACAMLLAQNEFDIKDTTKILLKEVDTSLCNGDLSNMPMFVKFLQSFIANKNRNVHLLIDKWVGNFLRFTSKTTSELLSLFQILISDLLNGVDWWTEENVEEIKRKLHDHVLPALKNHSNVNTAVTAASFISLYVRNPKHYSDLFPLYHYWTNCQDNDLLSNFIVHVFEYDENFRLLQNLIPDYHVDIVQCFLKVHFLKKNVSSGHERLTRIVAAIPDISQYSSITGYNWVEEDDSLAGFIKLFGALSKTVQEFKERLSVNKLFDKYFAKLEKWIEIGLQGFETDNYILISSMYKYSGLIAAECHAMAYKRSNPCTLLKTFIDKLLLPMKIFKNGFKIPTSMNRALMNSIPLYLNALVKLNPRSDFYINRTLREVVKFYFPHFVGFISNDFTQHPFHTSLNDAETISQLVTLMDNMFLTVSNSVPNPQALNCIKLYSSVQNLDSRDKIFEACVYDLLKFLKFSSMDHPAVKSAFVYIGDNVGSSKNSRKCLFNLLESMSSEEVFDSSDQFMKLLKELKSVCLKELGLLRLPLEIETVQLENTKNERDIIIRKLFLELKYMLTVHK